MVRVERYLPFTMQGESEETIQRYFQLVDKGESPGMAEILACRKFPALNSDEDMSKIPPLETVSPALARKVKAQAKAAGINVSDNSRYNATMADHRGGGDPKAWLHAGDGVSTYKQRLRECGGGSEDLGVEMDMSRIVARDEGHKAVRALKERQKKAAMQEKRDQFTKG